MHIANHQAAAGLIQPGVILMMAAESVDALEARVLALTGECETIQAKIEGDDFSDEDVAEVETKVEEIEKLKRRIEALKKLGSLKQSAGRKAPDAKPGAVHPTVRDSAKHNFLNMGEFAKAVQMQAVGQHDADGVKKLYAAATTYGNENAGVDGGFLVPPEFSRQLWQKVEAEENLMNRCAQQTPSGNSLSIPKDETTPWGTAGIRVYWEGEAGTVTQSKAAFELSTLRLYKLTALVPASDELLEDSTGYESFINAKVPGIMAATINDKIVDGTGAGQPLGILKSPSLLSVGKETSQPADTVWFSNINKMWSRMYAPWRRNSVWLINQDVEPSLHGMAFQATGASSMLPGTSAVPAYLPMNGLSTSPYATLMGRPVIPVQACKTVGDQGDIILVDLNQYWVLKKQSGLRTDTSMHLYFDQNVTAFRFVFRMNGQPAWSSAVTQQNGSNSLSWAVALDAR